MAGRLSVKPPRGFTLIELLVVMAIISILVACLLPAFVCGRAASRRVSCINNLKEIDLAIQSYLNSYNTLPSGCYDIVRPVSSVPDGYHVGWIVSILPFLEQHSLYRSFDFNYGADDPVNRRVGNTIIRTLVCPNEESLGTSTVFRPGGTAPPSTTPGLSSYAGVHHEVEAPIDEDNHGVLFLNSHVRAVDISDGLSQTFFVGEVAAPSPLGWTSGTRATLRNTGHPINAITREAVEQTGPTPAALPGDLKDVGLERMMRAGAVTVAPTFVGGFGSSHMGGGANFGFGDGSVRWIKQTIDQAVYQRLGHRSDGEVIDDDAY
jgi:prepilin-type N-terminal cleavage/methylation domain-containing protein/prepilin-type processing-associated H-X9-DG protein